MVRNSHGRKPKPVPSSGEDAFGRVRDTRRAYKRSHPRDWERAFEDEEVDELENFDALDDLEKDDLDALEEYVGSEEEEHS